MKSVNIAAGLFFIGVLLTSCHNNSKNSENHLSKNGNEVVVSPQKITFTIDGMTCPEGCAKTIQNKLSELKGVTSATVDFDKKLAIVSFDADKISKDSLVQSVENTGDGQTYKVSNILVK